MTRFREFLFVAIAGIGPVLAQTSLTQISTGWCSPNIANVTGNVSIVCKGVSPEALSTLNAHLSETEKQLSEKLAEANAWAQRYHELLALTAKLPKRTAALRSVEMMVKRGQLARAMRSLDDIIRGDKGSLMEAAQMHFLRAHVEDINFQFDLALGDYKRANQIMPEKTEYALGYGAALQRQTQHRQAIDVYREGIRGLQNKDQTQETLYDLARLGNALGRALWQVDEFKSAENEFESNLDVAHKLVSRFPGKYEGTLAETLYRCGELYESQDFLVKALNQYLAAERVLRVQTSIGNAVTLPYVLADIANIHTKLRNYKLAESYYSQARKLLEHPGSTRAVDQAQFAWILGQIGDLYEVWDRPKEAETSYLSALRIRSDLCVRMPEGYCASAAQTHERLAWLYMGSGSFPLGLSHAREAVALRRRLWKINKTLYGNALAESLIRLSVFMRAAGTDSDDACAITREAIEYATESSTKFGVATMQCATDEQQASATTGDKN
ncbi:MAG TPA: tetratricopeptide repeat protein [Bryobacteraceae bacterium]|nr:tetratricopeptide repeat protein [Bryobacteraceae bacterium]